MSSWKTRVAALAAILLVAYAAFAGSVYRAMCQSPERFGRFMSHMPVAIFLVFPFETMWTHARAGHLHVGDPAPKLQLATLDKSTNVSLDSFRHQKPVVLVFGSYTWPPFRQEVPALNKLYEQYESRVQFYAVYILEAHPSDVWQMESNIRDKVVFRSPANFEQRENIAGMCVRKLGIKFPALVDNFSNTTETSYTGWPDRIYLVDQDGRIAFKSRPGPFGFKPDELRAALGKLR